MWTTFLEWDKIKKCSRKEEVHMEIIHVVVHGTTETICLYVQSIR